MDLHKNARELTGANIGTNLPDILVEDNIEKVVSGMKDHLVDQYALTQSTATYIESLRQVIVRQEERIAKLEAKGQEA
jgi:hypothetical protein